MKRTKIPRHGIKHTTTVHHQPPSGIRGQVFLKSSSHHLPSVYLNQMARSSKTVSSPTVIAWTSEPLLPRLSRGAFVDLQDTRATCSSWPSRMVAGAYPATYPMVLAFIGRLPWEASDQTTVAMLLQSKFQ